MSHDYPELNFSDLFFGIPPLLDSLEIDRKQGRREGYNMQQGSPGWESNHGRCGYVVCALTIKPPNALQMICFVLSGPEPKYINLH